MFGILSLSRELSEQPNEPPDLDIEEREESESLDTSGGQIGLLDTSGGHTGLLDTSGAEELSVKTLADMFDFRLGEQVHCTRIFRGRILQTFRNLICIDFQNHVKGGGRQGTHCNKSHLCACG